MQSIKKDVNHCGCRCNCETYVDNFPAVTEAIKDYCGTYSPNIGLKNVNPSEWLIKPTGTPMGRFDTIDGGYSGRLHLPTALFLDYAQDRGLERYYVRQALRGKQSSQRLIRGGSLVWCHVLPCDFVTSVVPTNLRFENCR